MTKLKYYVQFSDTSVIKVRYYSTRGEAQRTLEELTDLCHRLINRGLILDYRFEISYR